VALGRWFKRLLGGSPEPAEGRPVPYGDYTITPTPMRQGGQFLTAGVIRKQTPEGVKEHRFIRADTHASEEAARDFAVHKAKQIIDQLGDRIFEER